MSNVMVCLDLKIPQKFLLLRTTDCVGFVVIPFCCPFKTTFIAEIPMDNLGDLIVSQLLLLLLLFNRLQLFFNVLFPT